MSRLSSLLGSAIFLVLAPGSVAGLGPWLITGWRAASTPDMLRWIGAALLLASGAALLECFFRFAWTAFGTPAPFAPTRDLVVAGLYRHVRNPMYLAVIGLVLGQALLFGAASLIGYAAIVWGFFHLFVVHYEEPTLEQNYPEAYPAYRRAVRRWLPQLSPWRPIRPGKSGSYWFCRRDRTGCRR